MSAAMIATEFIQELNDKLRGLDDEPPTEGTDEWNYWIRTANRLRRNLYKDTSKQWSSTFDILDLGTIAASAAPAFELDDTFLSPATSPYVLKASGYRETIPMQEPQSAATDTLEAYIAGQDPAVLYLSLQILESNSLIGGTLYLPAYVMPDEITEGDQTVIVDDPDWLIVATAAELAFGDLTYEDKAETLATEAAGLKRQMTANNRKPVFGQARRTVYDVPKIRGIR